LMSRIGKKRESCLAVGGKWKQKEWRTPLSYTATTREEMQVMYETSMLKCFVHWKLFHGSGWWFKVIVHTVNLQMGLYCDKI
jgi:hypothetical protein